MTFKAVTILTVSAAVLGLAACQTAGVKSLPPGEYKTTKTSKNSNGTDYKTKTTTNVGYDAYGNKQAVVKEEKTTDPKGLFNKSKSSSTTVVK